MDRKSRRRLSATGFAKCRAGRLDITLYTAGQLTPTKEIVESLGAGTIDISYTTGAYYTGIVPEANLEQAGLPPLVLDSLRDAINLYWYGELGEIIREGYAKEGVYYLGAVPWGGSYHFLEQGTYVWRG